MFSKEDTMTMGRGRGRGRGWFQDNKDPSPKPGRLLCTEDADCNTDLADIVNTITNKNIEQQAQEFLKLIDNDFKELYSKLHKHARNDKEFGWKLLRVIRFLHTSPKVDREKSSSLYKYMVSTLQNSYFERIEIKQKNTVQFYNDIYLLSEFVLYFKSEKPQLKHVLKAFLEYLEMLLETASIEEIRMFAEQMTIHGKFLCTYYKENVDKVMVMARQVLIKNDLPLTSRQMLLYTIDLDNQNFNPLPASLQEFYEQQLGKNFIQ